MPLDASALCNENNFITMTTVLARTRKHVWLKIFAVLSWGKEALQRGVDYCILITTERLKRSPTAKVHEETLKAAEQIRRRGASSFPRNWHPFDIKFKLSRRTTKARNPQHKRLYCKKL
jgi:hypothetical protein